MRLNWYLPVGRSSGKGHAPSARLSPPPSGATLPEGASSSQKKGLTTLLRSSFRRLGPTWAASPLHRLIQTTFFLLFLAIFFVILRPNPAPDTATGLIAQPQGSEFFLMLDPLVSLSTAIAARAWIGSLPAAGVILALSLLIPRVFCGYLCPMGTLIDIFDWLIGRRVTRFRVTGSGWWAHLKYYTLAGLLISSFFGVLLAGFFSAIPVLVRGMAFLLAPLQLGLTEGWHAVPPVHAGHIVSIVLFLAVLALGLLRPRFWCRYVCPTGAVFSLVSPLRLTQRNVEASCIKCGQCRRICPFDAVAADFTTRAADCTFCQACGGVCPSRAIQFTPRWNRLDLLPAAATPTSDVAFSRRGFLVAAVASGTIAVGTRRILGANLTSQSAVLPVRPPCSVPESQFLQMCIRCQACTKACPSELLQPLRFQQGLEGLWTPYANTDWAGCDPHCHRCGEACPTKAIRAVPLEEKQAARMGLSVVDTRTCLPHAGRENCHLCHQACKLAGHDAIELVRVRPELDDDGLPLPGTGYLAPSVQPDKCVGCGLCQSRCYNVNVRRKSLLTRAAIHVETGQGKEDRLSSGSYLALRQQERRGKPTSAAPITFQLPGQPNAPATAPATQPASNDLPDFMQ